MLYTEILIVLALILLNGFFAMSELAVVSARKARLKAMARAGVPGARSAIALAEEPGTFLPTVQIGITLIGILAGAFSGATVASKVAAWLARIPVAAAVQQRPRDRHRRRRHHLLLADHRRARPQADRIAQSRGHRHARSTGRCGRYRD